MSISKSAIFSVVAAALAVTACGRDASGPERPPELVQVDAPAWTKDLTLDVGKRSCTITKAGKTFMVASTGTDIGDGLTARRDRNDCYVKDQNNVQCNWDRIERNNWCKAPNPALKPE